MPQQSAFGEDAYIRREAVLILNGYELQMSDDHIAELFEKLGSDEIGQREFFGAISTHSHRSNLNEPSEP
jgi:hypothetical protein